MRSACVVPGDFLERIADPSSRFHSNYLAYQSGEMTRRELVARLPHIALLGDSVCLGIYISSPLSTFWRTSHCRDGNWFLDCNSPGLQSVSKRLEKFTPFVATEYAGVGAMVDQEGERQNIFRRAVGTRNLSGQIAALLKRRRFPDLVLIAIGHNNADWTWRCPSEELAQPQAHLQREARVFRDNFERQLRRLLQSAREQNHRIAIVVYGLINFGAYFQGRAEAERRRAEDRRFYPHLETTYKYLRSFHPDYRKHVVQMARMLNDQLQQLVAELSREIADSNLQLRYSDALANADLSRAELLHEIDGWHASVQGHNVLGSAAFEGLKASLEFLGIV